MVSGHSGLMMRVLSAETVALEALFFSVAVRVPLSIPVSKSSLMDFIACPRSPSC